MRVIILITLTFLALACTQKENKVNKDHEEVALIDQLREKDLGAERDGNLDTLMTVRTDDFVDILSDNDKSYIQAEELYRSAVQNQVNLKMTNDSQTARLWMFLNSSFGIWLLATVVVGTISWGYKVWEENRTAEARFKSKIIQLDIEINSNLQGIYDVLSLKTESINAFELHHLVRGKRFNIYNEFKDRDLRSLITELYYLVPINQQPEIANTLRALAQLYSLSPSASYDSGITVNEDILSTVKTLVYDIITIKRWKLDKNNETAIL